jgi:hypothetical protein
MAMMRGRRLALAAAWVIVGVTVSATPSVAAGSAHLSAAAATALLKSDNAATAAQCRAIQGASRDPEVQGVIGICLDSAAYGTWFLAAAGDCRAGADAACLRNAEGQAADLKADRAWDGWFVARLGAGDCQSYFTGVQRFDTSILGFLSPVIADVHNRRSAAQIESDVATQVRKTVALARQDAAVLKRDERACQP